MEASIKFLPIEMLSYDSDLTHKETIDFWVNAYTENKFPLIPVQSIGRFRRFRVLASTEVVAAAQLLSLDSLWVLILPNGELPFSVTATSPESNQQLQNDIMTTAQKTLSQAKAFKLAIHQGLSQKAVAKTFGVSRSYINNTLQLLKLPTYLQRALHDNQIGVSHARILSYENNTERQRELFQWVLRESASARELERAVYHKVSLKDERIQVLDLEKQLSDQWGCSVKLTLSGQGGVLICYPHIEQVNMLTEQIKNIEGLQSVRWTQEVREQNTRSSEKSAASAVLEASFVCHEGFSRWINAILTSQRDELCMDIEPRI